MSEHPTLYVCVGFPGVGKSTYVRTCKGVEVLSTDTMIEEIAKEQGKTYNEVFKDAIKVVEPVFWENVKDAFSYGDNVLIDRTNLSVKSRKRFLDMAPKDYCKVALWFHCSPETLEKRLANRPEKFIPKFVIEDMEKRFETPTVEEGFDSVNDIQTD